MRYYSKKHKNTYRDNDNHNKNRNNYHNNNQHNSGNYSTDWNGNRHNNNNHYNHRNNYPNNGYNYRNNQGGNQYGNNNQHNNGGHYKRERHQSYSQMLLRAILAIALSTGFGMFWYALSVGIRENILLFALSVFLLASGIIHIFIGIKKDMRHRKQK